MKALWFIGIFIQILLGSSIKDDATISAPFYSMFKANGIDTERDFIKVP